MIFVWTRGLRGPEPSRCDGDSILTLRKYQRILVEHKLSADMAAAPIDALAQRFPVPEVSDADQ